MGDRYDVPPSESLKGEEREKRDAVKKRSKEYEPCDAVQIPPWKEIIQNAQNKANLLNYIGEAWTACHSVKL